MGIALDYSAMTARLDALKSGDPANAVLDLMDVQRYAGAQLAGWDGLGRSTPGSMLRRAVVRWRDGADCANGTWRIVA